VDQKRKRAWQFGSRLQYFLRHLHDRSNPLTESLANIEIRRKSPICHLADSWKTTKKAKEPLQQSISSLRHKLNGLKGTDFTQ
jgi:hypothetical protein